MIVQFTFVFILLINLSQVSAAVKKGEFIFGTSGFMLVNLSDEVDEPPNFSQLNLGYQLTEKDVLSLEFITWRYYRPLGISHSELSNPDEAYPGYIQGSGVGIAYQRFLAGRFYTALHATWLNQRINNLETNVIRKGTQLFMAFRLGYRFQFLSGRFFIEPSMAVTHWPVNTGLPPEFEKLEEKWPKYQIEPGMHLGFLF